MTYSMKMGHRLVLAAKIGLKYPILAITPLKLCLGKLNLEQYLENLLQKECKNTLKFFPEYSCLGQSTILALEMSFKMLLGQKCVF